MKAALSRRALLAISGALAISSPMLASADVGFLGAFSTFGTFAGQISTGAGEALDANGNLYVADGFNSRISEFSSTGTFLQSVITEGTITVVHPLGVGISPGGLIYVANTGATNVEVFNSDASPNRQLAGGGTLAGQVSKPDDVKINSLGAIYVADANNHRVQVFNSSGVSTQIIGSQGSGAGQFDQPPSLAISPAASSFGDLFVVDNDSSPSVTTNRRVEIFDSGGNFVSSFGTYGSGNGQFVNPQAVAVSATGRVYVTDGPDASNPNNIRVEVFNDSGTFLSSFGEAAGPGQLGSVDGIAVAATGQLYVVNDGDQISRYFDPASWASGVNNFTSSFSGPTSVGVGSGQLLGQTLNLDSTKGLLVGGTTTVSAGGSLTVSGGSFSTGSLVISGAGAAFAFTGGSISAGAVSVNQGGLFDANHGNAVSVSGPITVSDAGSQFIVEQSATLSAATLTVGTAGLVALNTNGLLTANNASTNSGSINLAGGALTIHGTLANQTGGTIQGDGNLTADAGITNSGTIALAGTSNVAGAVDNTAAGTIKLSGVQPNVFFNDVVNDGTITIDAGSGATFLGEFSGANGIGGGGTAFLDGTVSPGHSPADISFGGNVSFGGSSSQILELGGLTRGSQYDAIDITGSASLAGTMDVKSINGFTPLPGQSFEVLTFTSRSGDVSVVNQTAFAGLHFTKNYTSNSLTLTASALPGDANLDGVVNVADFNALAGHFNASGQSWLAGDFNGDGKVNASDFDLLAANYGQSDLSAPPLGTLVPEPAAPLIALALFAVKAMRRRKQ